MNRLISPNGLHVFRVLYSLYLIAEVISLLIYYNLTFGDSNGKGFLFLWLAVIVCLGVGFYTWYAAVTNYIFSLIYFTGALSHAYHAHFIAISINLLLIFIPTYKEEKVPVYYYYTLAAFGLGFVYLDSFLFKMASPIWRDGLALWLGSSYLPIAIYERPLFGLSNDLFLNNETIMKIGNYGTLVFEGTFFIFLFTRLRFIVAIIGILLHLSIAVVYPLKLFGFEFVVFYSLLIPVKYWKPIPERKRSPVIKFNWIAILILLVIEGYIILFGTPLSSVLYRSGLGNVAEFGNRLLKQRGTINKITGLCNHTLFLDGHFVPRSVFKVTYQGKTLPFTTETGLCDVRLDGIGWKQWSSGTSFHPGITIEKFIKDWSEKHNCKGEFIVYEKQITPAKKFEKDFLKKQIDTPFKEINRIYY